MYQFRIDRTHNTIYLNLRLAPVLIRILFSQKLINLRLISNNQRKTQQQAIQKQRHLQFFKLDKSNQNVAVSNIKFRFYTFGEEGLGLPLGKMINLQYITIISRYTNDLALKDLINGLSKCQNLRRILIQGQYFDQIRADIFKAVWKLKKLVDCQIKHFL
ncbi:hypothetical protein ABPG72_006580 [Tetrahymena utriculariae]